MSSPNNEVDERKRTLRGEVRARLRALTPAEHASAGAAAAAPLLAWLARVAPPGPVALFAARANEIATDALDAGLRACARVRLLPTIEGERLVFRALDAEIAASALPLDAIGIPTPPVSAPVVALSEAALVVVPACAVDHHGRRLGWGKGFYDRALAARSVGGRAQGTVAFVHELQVVDQVPVLLTDVLVERLCTPAGGLRAVP